MDVALLLLGFLGCLLEVDRLAGGAVLHPAEELEEVVPEEDEVVEDGHQGEHHAGQGGEARSKDAEQAAQDAPGEQGRVNPRQPLDLDGDDEEQQHPHVGVQGGEGEEQGHVHIGHVGGDQIPQQAGGIGRGTDGVQHEAHHDVEHHTQAVEHVELGGAPLPLQHRADHVVEIQGDDQEKEAVVHGDKDKGDQPPDLPVQDIVGGKGQQAGQGHAVAELIQQPYQGAAHHDDQHEIGYAEPGVLVAEPIQPALDCTQDKLTSHRRATGPPYCFHSVPASGKKFTNKL